MHETTGKILYAEDDKLEAKLTKTILEQEDFEVSVAQDGAEAWKTYKAWKPDIILTDLDMGGKDGLELIQNIRKDNQGIHIIVYTSHSEPAKEVELLDAGADEFIGKDKAPQILTAHMKRIRERIKKQVNIPYIYQLSAHSTYNHMTRELTINGITTRLKRIDARFLQLLCAKNHEIASKSYLIQGVWNKAAINKEPELKKYICHVRAAIKADSALRIEYRNEGYVLITVS
ncbi:MAG: response regulator transcription factor [Odoribacter sp.]|nr:response regulator transcription factor [Odoribacter sp.]